MAIDRQNRLTEYFPTYKGPERRVFKEKGKQALDDVVNRLQRHEKYVTIKDMIMACNGETGSVGVISIPMDEKTASAVIARMRKNKYIREEDVLYFNQGVLQFSGFVNDSYNLRNTVRNKFLGVFEVMGLDINPNVVKPTCIDPSTAQYLKTPQQDKTVARELLDIAMGDDPTAEYATFDSPIYISPEITDDIALGTYLDIVQALNPNILGEYARVIFADLEDYDRSYLAFKQRDEEETQMRVDEISRKDPAERRPGEQAFMNSEVNRKYAVQSGTHLPLQHGYTFSSVLKKGDFMVISKDYAMNLEYDPGTDSVQETI